MKKERKKGKYTGALLRENAAKVKMTNFNLGTWILLKKCVSPELLSS